MHSCTYRRNKHLKSIFLLIEFRDESPKIWNEPHSLVEQLFIITVVPKKKVSKAQVKKGAEHTLDHLRQPYHHK
jgi:hypothetical protein